MLRNHSGTFQTRSAEEKMRHIMGLNFKRLNLTEEKQILIDWLSSHTWPFHGVATLLPYEVEKMIEEGVFDGTNHQTFWVLDDQESRVGCIRLFDLEDIGDGTPLFDLRLRAESRGRGIGFQSVRWLLDYMFTEWPLLHRIEATTRQDNEAMRSVLRKCGFTQEGHLRKSWRTADGGYQDTIVYGILREDWSMQL